MKNLVGDVVRVTGEKTAVVEVTRYRVHPLYEKRMKRTRRYLVHDDREVSVGDLVEFVETRPISKRKKWKIVRVLSKGQKIKSSQSQKNRG